MLCGSHNIYLKDQLPLLVIFLLYYFRNCLFSYFLTCLTIDKKKQYKYIVATNQKYRILLKCIKGCLVRIKQQYFNAILLKFHNLNAKFSSLISLGIGSYLLKVCIFTFFSICVKCFFYYILIWNVVCSFSIDFWFNQRWF